MGDRYQPNNRRRRSPAGRSGPYERNDRIDRNMRNMDFRPVAPGEPFDPPRRPRRNSRLSSPSRVQIPLPVHHGSRNGGGFVFRGAAGGDHYHPQPPKDFTYRASGPQFPSREPLRDLNSRPQTSRVDGNRPQESFRGNRGQNRGGRPAGRQRRGFGPPPAHTRDILHKRR